MGMSMTMGPVLSLGCPDICTTFDSSMLPSDSSTNNPVCSSLSYSQVLTCPQSCGRSPPACVTTLTVLTVERTGQQCQSLFRVAHRQVIVSLSPPPQSPVAVAHNKAAKQHDDKARQPEEYEREVLGRLHITRLLKYIVNPCSTSASQLDGHEQ